MKFDVNAILADTPEAVAKTKIVCTLGPTSRDVPVLEALLAAGMVSTAQHSGPRGRLPQRCREGAGAED